MPSISKEGEVKRYELFRGLGRIGGKSSDLRGK
jgi:hypothetical protein